MTRASEKEQRVFFQHARCILIVFSIIMNAIVMNIIYDSCAWLFLFFSPTREVLIKPEQIQMDVPLTSLLKILDIWTLARTNEFAAHVDSSKRIEEH